MILIYLCFEKKLWNVVLTAELCNSDCSPSLSERGAASSSIINIYIFMINPKASLCNSKSELDKATTCFVSCRDIWKSF